MQSEAKAKALEQFTDYFVKNYPGPDTIIYDPKWHAPKIFAAAHHAITAAQSDYETRIRSALVDVPAEPMAHLVWLQGRRSADDVEDYYEVARPGDKSIDGSDPFPVYTSPPLSREGEDTAEVEHTVGSHEITDFLYKHGDLTYSAAARAVQLLTGNGYGFTASSEARKESLLTMRKALSKIADMIDAEDADLDDAISIATTALAATRSGSATTSKGGDHG